MSPSKVHPYSNMCQNVIPFRRLDFIPLYVQTTFGLSTHYPSIDTGFFHFGVLVNNAARNTSAHHLSHQAPAFNYFAYMPRRGITGSEANSTVVLGTAILFSTVAASFFPSHQQCTSIPITPHPHQQFCFHAEVLKRDML